VLPYSSQLQVFFDLRAKYGREIKKNEIWQKEQPYRFTHREGYATGRAV
jgi:hypothetical protein